MRVCVPLLKGEKNHEKISCVSFGSTDADGSPCILCHPQKHGG